MKTWRGVLTMSIYLVCCLDGKLIAQGEWREVFFDSGSLQWEQNWFLEGEKAWVRNGEAGMTFSAGPIEGEHASHAVLWTRQTFTGNIKIEYDYTRLDTHMHTGVNILYIQASGLGTDEWPTDIAMSAPKRAEPWMKYYFLYMHALHISYATDGRYVSARRYPAESLQTFQKGTQFAPKYEDIDLFQPGETWHITVVKQHQSLRFIAERAGQTHAFEWGLDQFPAINEGRIGLRQMWTRQSRYQDIRVLVRE